MFLDMIRGERCFFNVNFCKLQSIKHIKKYHHKIVESFEVLSDPILAAQPLKAQNRFETSEESKSQDKFNKDAKNLK